VVVTFLILPTIGTGALPASIFPTSAGAAPFSLGCSGIKEVFAETTPIIKNLNKMMKMGVNDIKELEKEEDAIREEVRRILPLYCKRQHLPILSEYWEDEEEEEEEEGKWRKAACGFASFPRGTF